jgi:hypothetical protein
MKTNRTKKNSLIGVTTGLVAALFAAGCAAHQNEAHQHFASAASGIAQQSISVPGLFRRTAIEESKPWWPLIWAWRDEPRTKATNE